MTNPVALILGALIALGLGTDYAFYDMQGTLFLSRKLLDLIEWLAFWR
ncbi:MAG: hypothetical protein AAGA28_09925 [Pseudomonadota bacterium]